MKIDYSKYIISLIITVVIILFSFLLSKYWTDKRLNSLEDIQESISIDLLSTETQFLLKELSCSDESNIAVAKQITELGDKLSFAESNLGNDNEQVQFLKKYYSLLQIKDYLLGKKVLDTCGYKKRPIYMIYMYPSKTDCPDCVIQSGVLSKLREKYPELKVYTFDYDISLGPVETLKGIYKTKAEFPLLIIEDKPYYGLQTFDNIEKLLPNKLKDTIKSTPSSITVNKTKVINNKSTTSTSSSTGDKNNSIFANIFNTKSETVDPVNNNINTHSTNTGDIN